MAQSVLKVMCDHAKWIALFNISSQSQQHVFALVHWYIEDESKDKYGKPVEVWTKAFLPGGPSRFLPVLRIHSKFVVASVSVDKLGIVPLNRTFS